MSEEDKDKDTTETEQNRQHKVLNDQQTMAMILRALTGKTPLEASRILEEADKVIAGSMQWRPSQALQDYIDHYAGDYLNNENLER